MIRIKQKIAYEAFMLNRSVFEHFINSICQVFTENEDMSDLKSFSNYKKTPSLGKDSEKSQDNKPISHLFGDKK